MFYISSTDDNITIFDVKSVVVVEDEDRVNPELRINGYVMTSICCNSSNYDEVLLRLYELKRDICLIANGNWNPNRYIITEDLQLKKLQTLEEELRERRPRIIIDDREEVK